MSFNSDDIKESGLHALCGDQLQALYEQIRSTPDHDVEQLAQLCHAIARLGFLRLDAHPPDIYAKIATDAIRMRQSEICVEYRNRPR